MSKHSSGWYWLTVMNPTLYVAAKMSGKDASEQADGAIEDLGAFCVVLLLLFIPLAGAYFGLKALGVF